MQAGPYHNIGVRDTEFCMFLNQLALAHKAPAKERSEMKGCAAGGDRKCVPPTESP